MRIATYNLWNARVRWQERLDAACEKLARLDADVVALQEVAARASEHDERDAATYLAERCGYGYVETQLYPNDPDEGLAFLSKQPLHAVEAGWDTGLEALMNCGLRARLSVGGTEIAITNVHLDWENIAAREAQITQVVAWIAARLEEGCYEVLCGDFNGTPESSIYRFLTTSRRCWAGGAGVGTIWRVSTRRGAADRPNRRSISGITRAGRTRRRSRYRRGLTGFSCGISSTRVYPPLAYRTLAFSVPTRLPRRSSSQATITAYTPTSTSIGETT